MRPGLAGCAVRVADRFPAIEPYESGLLDVGDSHLVYWEAVPNATGRPARYVHGGPPM